MQDRKKKHKSNFSKYEKTSHFDFYHKDDKGRKGVRKCQK